MGPTLELLDAISGSIARSPPFFYKALLGPYIEDLTFFKYVSRKPELPPEIIFSMILGVFSRCFFPYDYSGVCPNLSLNKSISTFLTADGCFKEVGIENLLVWKAVFKILSS